jgi:hypothetical protein
LQLSSLLHNAEQKGAPALFNVWSERKRMEKLRDMHRNPMKRGLG